MNCEKFGKKTLSNKNPAHGINTTKQAIIVNKLNILLLFGRMHKLLLILLLLTGSAIGQEYVYVNTDNLLLRDRPEKEYNVFDVLHAPCRLQRLPYSDAYKEDRAVKNKFYHVVLTMQDEATRRTYSSYGWVEKQYVVKDHDKITARYSDSSEFISFTKTELSCDPYDFNFRSYPCPQYKGGEKNLPPPFKPKYCKGPRGGCYYINQKGRKVYVESKMCKCKGSY